METCHGFVHRMRYRSARQGKGLFGLWSAQALCRWGTLCRGRACRLIPLAGIGNDVRRSPSRHCPYPERGPSRRPSRSRRGRRPIREPPTVRSWVGDTDLALCALALGVASVVFGLLGQGWFGIVAIACGHQARRRMAGHRAVMVGSVLAMTGLVLGSAAVVMMLGSLVGGPPWN